MGLHHFDGLIAYVLDRDEWAEHAEEVYRRVDAALREVGGRFDRAGRRLCVPSPDDARRAWNLAVGSLGLACEMLTSEDYNERLTAEYPNVGIRLKVLA